MKPETTAKPNNVVNLEAFEQKQKLSKLTSLQLRRLRTKNVPKKEKIKMRLHFGKPRLLPIDDVCTIARCSKPTLYRRLRDTTFPQPIKVPTTAPNGPRLVNRWNETEVRIWLLQRNDPRWTRIEAQLNAEKGLTLWLKRNDLVVKAISGGLLAGLVYNYFPVG